MGTNAQNISQKELDLLKKKGFRLELKPLNSGAYATVYKARSDGRDLAIKVIDCEMVSDDYRLRFLPRELVFVVMELAEGGDLIDFVTYGSIDEPKAKLFFRQISEALEYMHSTGIAHRDLKCENILLDKSRTVAKLSDFGFARTCYDNKTGKRMLSETQCGTAGYASPELFSGKPFDPIRSDCWSVGCILYIILTKTFPFGSDNVKAIKRRQLKKKIKLQELELTEHCKDLISKLLETDFNIRLNMKQTLNHKWIKNIRV